MIYAIHDAQGRISQCIEMPDDDPIAAHLAGMPGALALPVPHWCDGERDFVSSGALAPRPALPTLAINGRVVSGSGFPPGAEFLVRFGDELSGSWTIAADGLLEVEFADTGDWRIDVSERFPFLPRSYLVSVS